MVKGGHIVIAGAGIIGLACALELRRRGMRVTVFEAGVPMLESSWAAGGMLAVDDPENPPAFLPLSRYSRTSYDAFLAEVAALSGTAVPFRTHETLQLVAETHTALGQLLTPEQAGQLVAGLALQQPYTLLTEASLDPRDLCAALPVAARASGVELRPHEPVHAVDSGRASVFNEGAGVRVTTSRGVYQADAFLNCCGAWAGSLGAAAAVTPRKGQMMVVSQPPHAPTLTRVLRSADIYLVPRGDGRIAIGATVEDAGFSKRVEPAALHMLRLRAAALWPPVLDAPLLESWAGLRPATGDGLPLLGRGAQPAQFLAAGHYRNGILLAPGTARAMADLICDRQPAIDLAPFDPARNLAQPACDNRFAAAL